MRYATLQGARYGVEDADTALAEVPTQTTSGVWERGSWRCAEGPDKGELTEVRITFTRGSEDVDGTPAYWVAVRCGATDEGVGNVRLEHDAAGPTSQRETLVPVNDKTQRLLHMVAAAAVAKRQRERR